MAREEEEEGTDDDDDDEGNEALRLEGARLSGKGIRCHSEHHQRERGYADAGRADANTHGVCAGDQSNQVGVQNERNGDSNKEGELPGPMGIDADGGCTDGPPEHENAAVRVRERPGLMDVDADGGCRDSSLGHGRDVGQGAAGSFFAENAPSTNEKEGENAPVAREGEHPGPMDADADGGCGDSSLGHGLDGVGQGAAQSGPAENPSPTEETVSEASLGKRKNPARDAKGRKRGSPSPPNPRPKPRPQFKLKRKLKRKSEPGPRAKLQSPAASGASANAIARNYFEEIEFGGESRLVDMIDLTHDMVGCFSR
jgi:hypothetical protein